MKILGFGKSIPEKIVTNDDLSKIVDTTDEWIVQRTGIKERRISNKNTSFLAYEAAVKAINDAKINKDEIDLIICATSTPDNFFPSVACMVQEKLNISGNVTAFDINAACTGFVYALKVASSLLNTYHKQALVIGAEVLSKIVNFNDRNTCVLFGDGAGAVVVEAGEGLSKFYTRSLGEGENLNAKGVNMSDKFPKESVKCNFLQMNGTEVFKFAISAIEEAILNILAENELALDDIKLIVPHQANKRIIANVARKLKVEESKFYINLDKYGNTSAASIPVALSEAVENNIVKSGDKVLLVGFGAGLTWGATIIEL